MSGLFQNLFYQPLYNGFIFLFDLLPWLDAGLIVILFTVLVRLVLFPLSKKALTTQLQMKRIEGDLKSIREKYKDDKPEQARKTMELYKERNINPFSSVLFLLIQLPIMFALYYVFIKTGLPNVNQSLLYPFVKIPDAINMEFLGLVNISARNIFLAFLAALSTYFQAKFSLAGNQNPVGNPNSFQEQFAKSMQMQMKYVFPILVFFIAYKISAVIAIYWITSSTFTIFQEIVIRKKLKEGVI